MIGFDINSLGGKLIDNQNLSKKLESIGVASVDGLAERTEPSGNIKLTKNITRPNAFYHRPITSVTGSCELIENSAFACCEELKSVSFPNLIELKGMVFRNCFSLVDVSIPSVTDIGTSVFVNCTSLKRISLPMANHLATGVFQGCSNLKDVSIPLADILYAQCFKDCASLEIIDLPSATKINLNVFNSCHKLRTVILRNQTLVELGGVKAFTDTPFIGYNNLTADLYVPTALVEEYKSATNWSTILSNGFTTIHAIEGSEYEKE